jgi:hypothetical protein
VETARDEAVRRELQIRIAEERKKAEERARELAIYPEQEPGTRQGGSSRARDSNVGGERARGTSPD